MLLVQQSQSLLQHLTRKNSHSKHLYSKGAFSLTDTENFIAKNSCNAHNNKIPCVLHSQSAYFIYEKSTGDKYQKDVEGQCCMSIFIGKQGRRDLRRSQAKSPAQSCISCKVTTQLLKALTNLFSKTLKNGHFPFFFIQIQTTF